MNPPFHAFKTDENLHPEVAVFLRSLGHDAVTVWDQHLRGTHDDNLATVCQLEKRAILTLDMDFADIRTYPPAEYFGIVVLRLPDQGRQSVLQAVRRFITTLRTEPLTGQLWIVEESRIRVRDPA